jgi:hypothetical protein
MLPARLGLVLRTRALEAQASALARGYQTTGVGRARGWSFGGGVALTAYLPLRAPVLPGLRAGLDLHARRLDVRVERRSVLTTDHVAPWMGVVLGWRGRP